MTMKGYSTLPGFLESGPYHQIFQYHIQGTFPYQQWLHLKIVLTYNFFYVFIGKIFLKKIELIVSKGKENAEKDDFE